MNFAQATICGHLGNDPELRQAGNHHVAELRIAVNNKRRQNEPTLWMECVVWNKTAEVAAKYLKKGACVLVSGRLKQEEWNNKDGEKRTKIRVDVSELVFGPMAEAAVSRKPQPEVRDDFDDFGDIDNQEEIPF